MNLLRYTPVLTFPLIAGAAFGLGGVWTGLLPLVAFGLIPLAELLLPADRANHDEGTEAALRESSWAYDALIYAFVPLQWGLMALFLWQLSRSAFSGLELVGAVFTMGILCGGFGINVGHELGHRRGRLEQWLAKASLASSLYTHFYIEHNRGHHAKVSTSEDPASAPQGRTVFGHWARSVPGTWLEAWRIEARRLEKKGLSWWHPSNEMWQLQGAQLLILVLILAALGPVALAGFVAASVVGFLLLETLNYIEHYGLRRQQTQPGRYERVRPEHSWNSDHPIGRTLLFELSRHSDHHANPGRPYQVLRSFEQAPQFPTGYPGMIVLALCPPLFFAVMHPRLEQWRAQYTS